MPAAMSWLASLNCSRLLLKKNCCLRAQFFFSFKNFLYSLLFLSCSSSCGCLFSKKTIPFNNLLPTCGLILLGCKLLIFSTITYWLFLFHSIGVKFSSTLSFCHGADILESTYKQKYGCLVLSVLELSDVRSP